MVACKNTLYCLNLGKNYLWTKPASIKKRMTGYIKQTHLALFTGQTKYGETHLVLGLIEKEYNKDFDFIIIIRPTFRENSTYHAKEWIKNDDKV